MVVAMTLAAAFCGVDVGRGVGLCVTQSVSAVVCCDGVHCLLFRTLFPVLIWVLRVLHFDVVLRSSYVP